VNVLLLTSVPMTPPWDQGDKNLAYTLARALPQVSFRVLTTHRAEPPPHHNLHMLPLYRSRRPSMLQKAAVFSWLRGQQADELLIHLVYRPYALSSCLLRRLPAMRRSLHTVPATNDQHYLVPGLFFSRRLATISAYGQRRLQDMGLERVEHIPPGIFVEDWQALASQGEAMKARLGLSGRPLVLFPGHYGPGQGAETLVQALPEVLQHVPEAVFLFACRLRSPRDRRVEGRIKARLQSAGLLEAARFFNVVPDMKSLIGASDLVALPLQTLRDKLDIPTTLLEAMAAGRPLVISDLAPMNEVLLDEHGQPPTSQRSAAGLTFPPGDALALADALIRLLQDASLRQRMQLNAQRLVQARYDIRRAAARYAQIYQELAHEN
jgi:glycosyltransferase involved in cell wall biosynthesis